jgi:hypothetical protein
MYRNHCSSLLQGGIGILHILLVLLLLQVLLKPGNQISRGRELLVMEVEARAAHLDQLANGIALLEHVDQQHELGVVLRDTEVVVDVAAVLLGLTTGLVLNSINRQI